MPPFSHPTWPMSASLRVSLFLGDDDGNECANPEEDDPEGPEPEPEPEPEDDPEDPEEADEDDDSEEAEGGISIFGLFDAWSLWSGPLRGAGACVHAHGEGGTRQAPPLLLPPCHPRMSIWCVHLLVYVL